MLRRFIENLMSRSDPLAAKQNRAVRLQEDHGGWCAELFEEFSEEEIRRAGENHHLIEAECLFREILEEGRDQLSPGKKAVTTYHLAQLLHCQGRLGEAQELYEECVGLCRECVEATETTDWALSRALSRLGELIIREDPQRGELLFEESRQIAYVRNDRGAISINEHAIQYFGIDKTRKRSKANVQDGLGRVSR